MKRRITSFALCTLFGLGAAMAQSSPAQDSPQTAPAQAEGRHRAPDPEHESNMLGKRLNLTADQQTQLLPILTERAQAIQSVRQDSSLSAQDRRAKIRSARESADTKIEALLTDAQKQQYEQLKQQMRNRAHGQNSGTAASDGRAQN